MDYSEAALQKVREDRLLIDQVDLWLYEEIVSYLGHRILEIGCGLGNFARYLVDRELYIGTEVSAESVATSAAQFREQPQMRFEVADATHEDFLRFAQSRIDTVFSLNVFEHIADHETALRHAVGVLRPGGYLVLVVPAHSWLYGSIDLAIGHYRRYSQAMMIALFRDAGLEVCEHKYINALGALGWFANGRIRRQHTPPAGQLRLLNPIVPALKSIERRLPPPFGISVLAVGRKPSR